MRAPSSLSLHSDEMHTHAADAASLAASLPLIAMEARRLAASISLGLHGRGRAGPGESFWQYRALRNGEAQTRIDWRKSARHADTLYVRDHEWEAARAFHIFIDRSRSLHYSSGKHPQKIDHAVIMGLALADLLVRSGERVGLIGQTPPSASRQIIDRLAEALLHPVDHDAGLPRPLPLSKQAHLILIGDFLIEPETIEKTLAEFDRDDVSITILRILDPAEVNFPFSGETELLSAESALALDIGDAAEFASEARAKLQAHEQALYQIAKNHRAFLITHQTDQAMTQDLLALMTHFAQRRNRGALRAHG